MSIMNVSFAALGPPISFFISHQNLTKEHQVPKTSFVEEEAKRRELQTIKKAIKERLSEERRASKELIKEEGVEGSVEVLPQEEV
ncbi:hypothetical protein BGZ60DRAFT_422224 [Tricladium varicosporioides]|nr:hypothetical protein BGZ60DRAFT_422224 [Hymenoscyphus varicosporioides]